MKGVVPSVVGVVPSEVGVVLSMHRGIPGMGVWGLLGLPGGLRSFVLYCVGVAVEVEVDVVNLIIFSTHCVLRGAWVGVLRGAGVGVLRSAAVGVLRGAGVGVLRGAGVGVLHSTRVGVLRGAGLVCCGVHG